MLLRRITKHVKDQNWFAVFIDFLIVVVGVFIGIQVANWNASNLSHAKEQKVLTQLYDEFKLTVADAKANLEKNDNATQATFEVLKIINANAEPEDQLGFAQLLAHAGRYSALTYESSTLKELLSSGNFSDISSASLRSALIQFNQTLIIHRKYDDLVLDRISTPHDGFHDAVILQFGQTMNDPITATYDWIQVANTRQQFQVLFYGKSGLSRNMQQLIEDCELVLKELSMALKL